MRTPTSALAFLCIALPGPARAFQNQEPRGWPAAQAAEPDQAWPAPAPTPRATDPARRVPVDRAVPSSPAAAGRTAPSSPWPLWARRATRVVWDESEAGVLWARGSDYKACFEAGRTSFIPFLGSQAPRNHPLELRLESASVAGEELSIASAAAPSRQGDALALERTGLLERYQLGPDGLEQLFEFPALPQRGELRLRLGFRTDLAPRVVPEGIVFAAELGGVVYGRATAIDARGVRCEALELLADGALEIVVPADFVAQALLPLVIDPWIWTFGIAGYSIETFAPDVAYDASTDRYLAVWEERFSGTDHDVAYMLLTSGGSSHTFGYIDNTAEFWAHPRCAGNAFTDEFLVVAEVGSPASGARSIRGRRVGAVPPLIGPRFTIDGGESGDKLNPDVGGDFYGSSATYYCVVWERAASASNHDIHARLVWNDGTLPGATILLDNSAATFDSEPSISNCNGKYTVLPSSDWNIVWQRRFSASDYDIYGAQVHWNGAVTAPSTAIDTSAADTRHPSASPLLDQSLPGGSPWLLVYSHDYGTDHDIDFRLMSGMNALESGGITFREHLAGAGNLYEDQVRPSVDADGARFVVAYAESHLGSATNYDVFAATCTPYESALHVSEPHAQLTPWGWTEDHPRVCTTRSGGGADLRSCVVHDELSGSLLLVSGSIYDAGQFTAYCFPGDDAQGCPCANPPSGQRGCNNSSNTGGALLAASGSASISADTLVFTSSGEKPTATSVFLQGNNLADQVFGQGVRCVGGSLRRLYTKTASGGVVTAPAGLDPGVAARATALGDLIAVGLQRMYCVYYRDPQVLGGCPSASTFNVTQSLRLIWLP